MRSLIAALRTLVLPAGTTSGRRIVLDGVEGEIEVYDTNNILRVNIGEDSAVKVYDVSGDLRISLEAGTLKVFDDNEVQIGSISASNGFRSDDATTDAFVQMHSQPSSAFLMMGPPEPAGESFVFGIIDTDYDDLGGSVYRPRMTLLGPNDVGKDFGAIFLDGETTDGLQRPKLTVGGFNEMHLNLPDGDFVHNGVSAPRGTRPAGLATAAGPTALSNTAGTWTDLVTLSNYPVEGGRRYLITGDPGHSTVSGGSGFAVGDFWDYEVERDEGAGYGAITPVRPFKRYRNNAGTVAQRWPSPIVLGIYHPAADDTVSFKMRAVKGGGAATVTSTVDTAGGASPHMILVQDIGAA
jgi:hypothetical protein